MPSSRPVIASLRFRTLAVFVPLLGAGCLQPPPAVMPEDAAAQAEPEPAAKPEPTQAEPATEALQLPLHLTGAVEAPGAPPIAFHAQLGQAEDGTASGTLAIPAQGVEGAPLEVERTGEAVKFTLAQAGASWTITPADGGLQCDFAQQGYEMPCTIEAVSAEQYAELATPKRPQMPEPPFPYESEEVTYENAQDEVTLAGTLTIPQGNDKVPAILLVTGSGAQDRDQSIAGHKPFWVIADHLSRNGVAVLRVDDRGVGGSSAGSGQPTSEDLANDVRAGLAFLRKHPRIDPTQVGIAGHSEGGLIAPMVASNAPKDVAFVVMLAGPGVPGAELLVEQVGALLQASGAPPRVIAQAKEQQREVVEIIAKSKDEAATRAKLQELLDPDGAAGEQMNAQIDTLLSPWFRFFLDYDPRPMLRKVRAPVLVIAGGKDVQVVADQNVPEIEKALKAGKAKAVRVEVFDDLNHLFQHAETGNVSEYATIEETVAPEVLKLMSSWIREQTGTKPAKPETAKKK